MRTTVRTGSVRPVKQVNKSMAPRACMLVKDGWDFILRPSWLEFFHSTLFTCHDLYHQLFSSSSLSILFQYRLLMPWAPFRSLTFS